MTQFVSFASLCGHESTKRLSENNSPVDTLNRKHHPTLIYAFPPPSRI